jgi:hypothetical protein
MPRVRGFADTFMEVSNIWFKRCMKTDVGILAVPGVKTF